MRWRNFIPSHNWLTLIAMLAGALTAWVDNGSLNGAADATAEIAVRLMKMMAVPLLFLSIVCSAAHFRNLDEIKFLGKKIVKYTILTTMLAALVAEGLYLTLGPWLLGQDILMPSDKKPGEPSGFFSAFFDMVPDNMLKAFLENNVLAVVVMAIALALGLLSIKKAREKEIVFSFFTGLLDALMSIVQAGLKLLPLAIWAFVTILVRQILSEETGSLNAIGSLTITVITANLVQAFIVLPLLLFYKGINPWRLFIKVKEALILAFFTRSSTATLPVTLEHSIKDAKISENVARLALPLCTTINMNGCAQFILLSVYFVSAFTGNGLMWWEHIGMIVLAIVAAIGNAGVPMGCFFLASSILASKNVPIHLMGSILPLYALIDMVETSLNVWSDVSVAKIVDEEAKEKAVQVKQ